jgi:hypothetical protein
MVSPPPPRIALCALSRYTPHPVIPTWMAMQCGVCICVWGLPHTLEALGARLIGRHALAVALSLNHLNHDPHAHSRLYALGARWHADSLQGLVKWDPYLVLGLAHDPRPLHESLRCPARLAEIHNVRPHSLTHHRTPPPPLPSHNTAPCPHPRCKHTHRLSLTSSTPGMLACNLDAAACAGAASQVHTRNPNEGGKLTYQMCNVYALLFLSTRRTWTFPSVCTLTAAATPWSEGSVSTPHCSAVLHACSHTRTPGSLLDGWTDGWIDVCPGARCTPGSPWRSSTRPSPLPTSC